ncbi:HTH_Tnp_Tc3_2 domain-containing protein [Trichonephila clavipes]|nr:HTH_Tnp_Tc3_2 domain-containing protein [Trichonephila clavipes]
MPNNHTTWPFLAAVDFLHHENPPTWAKVESATLGADVQRQTNYTTQSALAEFWKYPRNLESPRVVISRLWQRFQDDGNVSRCYSTGCPRVTPPNEDRYLAVTAKRNRRRTASDWSR